MLTKTKRKIAKTLIFKISKNPKHSCVSTIRKNHQEKFENIRLRFVGVAFSNFCSHRVPCYRTKTKIFVKKIKKKKKFFKNSKKI